MSKISICNLALARIGADSIRSFSENNKRARMCDTFFDSTRDFLLAKIDWPFASSYKVLNIVDLGEGNLPDGQYAYALPSDCKMPRALHPRSSKLWWKIMGKNLVCLIPGGSATVGLYYTAATVDTNIFTDSFVDLLSLALALRLAPPITQDKALVNALQGLYQAELRDTEEIDANAGNEYRGLDEEPDMDTFVWPDGFNPDGTGNQRY